MSKRIGLVDVDGHHYPNLALMKLSAYHKALGDTVEFAGSLFHYDKIYMAKVFDDTYTQDDLQAYDADEIVKGGTGYDLTSTLPAEIEHIYPDYSLYGATDDAYGFLTRGCPRHCRFCIVGDKEGTASRKVADLSEFWRGQKRINLLDPNLLACPDCLNLLAQLRDSGAWVDFTQGLDIRLITLSKIRILNEMKVKMIHFAWDNPTDTVTPVRLAIYRKYIKYDHRKIGVYVLCNFGSTFEQDLDRIYRLRDLDYDPYVMIYDKPHAPHKVRLLQRWCNRKWVFQSCKKFEDYDPRLA